MLMVPTTNYSGHGFYQFSQDLFWDILDSNGFCIQDISYIEEYGNEIYVSYKMEGLIMDDIISERRACIYVCAKKMEHTPVKLIGQQSKCQFSAISDICGGGGKFRFYDMKREIANILQGEKNKYRKLDKKILLYGAGNACRLLLQDKVLVSDRLEIVGIADQNAKLIEIEGFLVEEFEYFNNIDFDCIVITAEGKVEQEIKKDLLEKYGYNKVRIVSKDILYYYLRSCIY